MRSLILLLLAAPALVAQDKPDFSGRWVLVASKQPGAETPRTLSVRQSLVRTNVRGEPMDPYFKEISIEREFVSATRTETHAIGIVGGSVSGIVGTGKPAGSRSHHAVKWDGNALVFEHGSYTGDLPKTGVWTERREVWSLEPGGRLRVTISTRGSADLSGTTTNLTYRRP
jgi:hypothetical protein